MPLRVLIVDDEPLARRRIKRLLKTEAEVEIAGECGNGHDAVALIEVERPDLVFLDVQMPGTSGFDVLRTLPREKRPAIVFVTAYDQYAVRAFEVHALDYLLKPFSRTRFAATLERARAHLQGAGSGGLDPRLTALLEDLVQERLQARQAQPASPGVPAPSLHAERLLVKDSGSIVFVPVEDIDWIEAAGNYVRLHVGTKSHLLRETMSNLAARLDSSRFLRIHRSTLVNVARIRELQPWFHGDQAVILKDGTQLTLSRTFRESFFKTLGQGV